MVMGEDVWADIIEEFGPKHPLHRVMVERRAEGLRRHEQPLAYAVGSTGIDAAAVRLRNQLLDSAAYAWSIGAKRTAYQSLAAVLSLEVALRPDGEVVQAAKVLPLNERVRKL